MSMLLYAQKWPEKGILNKNMNKTLPALRKMLDHEHGPTHTYVIKSIVSNLGETSKKFFQDGCTPNFEGGLLTYTACRLDIQARNTKDEWKGQWLAGFTSRQRHGDYYLVFLMKISQAFNSFKEMWENVDPSARSIKNARNNQLGDLYEPTSHEIEDVWDPQNYYPPTCNHPHFQKNRWHKDISYLHKQWKSRPCQLVGDTEKSYLWSFPSIKKHHPFKSPRSGKKYTDLETFLKDLCSVE